MPGAAQMRPLGAVGLAATLYCAVAGLISGLWLEAFDPEAGWLDAVLCAAPALFALALALGSQADRRQYVARLFACVLLLPILLLMGSALRDLEQAPALLFGGGFALLHVLGLVAMVAWLAKATTRVEAGMAAPKVLPEVLGRRLMSLRAEGLPIDIQAGTVPDDWVVDLRFDAATARAHRVLLTVDPATREVRVRERVGASGAAPDDADEASMRTVGDDAFDPSRPQAQRVWARTLQTTMLDPQRLASVPLRLHGPSAHLDAADPKAFDAEGVLTLLAALVTGSGFAWQPVIAAPRART